MELKPVKSMWYHSYEIFFSEKNMRAKLSKSRPCLTVGFEHGTSLHTTHGGTIHNYCTLPMGCGLCLLWQWGYVRACRPWSKELGSFCGPRCLSGPLPVTHVGLDLCTQLGHYGHPGRVWVWIRFRFLVNGKDLAHVQLEGLQDSCKSYIEWTSVLVSRTVCI